MVSWIILPTNEATLKILRSLLQKCFWYKYCCISIHAMPAQVIILHFFVRQQIIHVLTKSWEQNYCVFICEIQIVYQTNSINLICVLKIQEKVPIEKGDYPGTNWIRSGIVKNHTYDSFPLY